LDPKPLEQQDNCHAPREVENRVKVLVTADFAQYLGGLRPDLGILGQPTACQKFCLLGSKSTRIIRPFSPPSTHFKDPP
jgi:hypothetical protein